jgi:hypothetical protein
MSDVYLTMTYDKLLVYVYLSYDIVCHITGIFMELPGIRHLSYMRYIPRIYLSFDIWIFGGICLVTLVYTRYIPFNLKSGDPVRRRIANEMQQHTDFGLHGCIMRSPERGGATGHPSARASPEPSGRRLQSRATDVRVGGCGGVALPPQTPTK